MTVESFADPVTASSKVSMLIPRSASLDAAASKSPPIASRFSPNDEKEMSESRMDSPNSSHRSAVVPRSALTAAMSRELNISEIYWIFFSSVSPDMASPMSSMMSCMSRILPSASKIDSPSALIAAAPSSVGEASFRIMFLRCVPASLPLMPLSARMPRTVASRSVPPAMTSAVPPIVRIASPSCATLVFDLLAAFAIWSTRSDVSPSVRPSALAASVTMSDASASPIPPAAARSSTVGSMDIAVSASYPANAM